jgi:hypothetical protein
VTFTVEKDEVNGLVHFQKASSRDNMTHCCCYCYLQGEMKGLKKCLNHLEQDIEEVMQLTTSSTLKGKNGKGHGSTNNRGK